MPSDSLTKYTPDEFFEAFQLYLCKPFLLILSTKVSILRPFISYISSITLVSFIIENEIVESLINIGSGEEISILSLAEKIQNIIGYKGKLIFDSSKPDGNPRKLLDSSLINNYGWKSSTTLDTGLRIAYDWFISNEI